MARIVVSEPRGGLGDALLYSTLPELYARIGHDVFIKAKPRNTEVAKLLYSDNPFIAGYAEPHETPNAGAVHDRNFFHLAKRSSSPIALIEQLHFSRHENVRPKVYYRPKHRAEFKDRVLADSTSLSQFFPPVAFEQFADRLFSREDITILSSPNAGNMGRGALGNCAQHQVCDIYEYMDLIYSCKAFLVTESGGQSLAAAIRGDNIFVLCTNAHMNSRFFVYPGVLYTVVDGLSPTYLTVDPVAAIL